MSANEQTKKNNNQQKKQGQPRKRNRNKKKKQPAGAKVAMNEKIPDKQKQVIRNMARARGDKVTPVEALNTGQGVLKVIPVPIKIDQVSFNCIPCCEVSLALARGGVEPYAFYNSIYQDIYSIASGTLTDQGTVRLKVFDEIYGALSPKTVPFRGIASLNYTIQPLAQTTTPFLSVLGGFTWYMYNPGGVDLGVWATQDPPAPLSDPEAVANYIANLNLVSGSEPHLTTVRNVGLGKRYEKDISAFTRNSPYYGQGGGIGAPYSSVEGEVPYRSPMLGTLVKFSTDMPRASRKLDYSSGDSCSSWGIGATKHFKTSFYEGAVPPIYKFLDLSELVGYMCVILGSAIELFYKDAGPGIGADTLAALQAGMGCTYTQFVIMVRQQICWWFNESQSVGQFLTPDNCPLGDGPFLPLLMGSNCFGECPSNVLMAPTVLVENLRGLMMCTREYVTRNYPSPKNHITHVPVWGIFANSSPINFQYFLGDTSYFLFRPENTDSNTPRIIDGASGGSVVDFNNSEIVGLIAGYWNDFMGILANQFSSLTPFGGASSGSPFLQFTRYVKWNNALKEIKQMRRVPRILQSYTEDVDVPVKSDIPVEGRGLLERKSSVKQTVKKRLFNPPSSSLFTEYSAAYSGVIPITDTHKAVFSQLILPVIQLQDALLPSQVQIQTSSIEPYWYSNLAPEGTNSPFVTRINDIVAAVPNYVTGTAGRDTELASFMKTMSDMNEGGFFGDLLSTVGNVAGSLGFGGIAGIAGVAGNIAKSLNV